METIKRDLARVVLGKEIKEVTVRDRKTVKSGTADFKKRLTGSSFSGLERVGKLLVFKLRGGRHYLLLHLKMTGQLIYCDEKKCAGGGHSLETDLGHSLPGPDNKYTRVVFKFRDGSELFFNDLRRFGYAKLVDGPRLGRVLAGFGIEPLKKNFTREKLKQILDKRKASIKAVLMNQKLIAGIGNIYADEILFRAKVRPNRPAGNLSDNEIEKIFKASREIIKKAIQYRGTTFSDYRDGRGKKGNFTRLLRVYGRAGQKCYRCGEVVLKKRIAGRGTHYCPNCQQ